MKRHKGYHQKKTGPSSVVSHKEAMKIIFLEVHGTLLLPICHGVSRLLQKPLVGFKPSVENLNFIVRGTGAELVVLSGPDNNLIDNLQTKFGDWGLTKTSFDRVPIADKKGHAIIKWMAIAGEPESFVILESKAKDYGRMLWPYLIVADKEAGITEAMAKKAIKILNQKGKK